MLEFSPARPEDLELLFQLNKQLIDTYEDTAAIDYERVLTWVHKNLEQTLPHFIRVLWNGETAGFYALVLTEDKTELDSLFVLPPFQNRGIGTQILRRCMEMTQTPLFLYVFRRNTGAIGLYERLGFRITIEVGKTRYIMEYAKQGCF